MFDQLHDYLAMESAKVQVILLQVAETEGGIAAKNRGVSSGMPAIGRK